MKDSPIAFIAEYYECAEDTVRDAINYYFGRSYMQKRYEHIRRHYEKIVYEGWDVNYLRVYFELPSVKSHLGRIFNNWVREIYNEEISHTEKRTQLITERIRALIRQGYITYDDLLQFFPGLNKKSLGHILQNKMRGIIIERNELYFRPRAIQMLKDNMVEDEIDLLIKLGFKQSRTSKTSFYYGDYKNLAWNIDNLIRDILGMEFQTARKIYISNIL